MTDNELQMAYYSQYKYTISLKGHIIDFEIDQYQKTGELRKQTSDLNYKAQYEADRNNFTSLAVTKGKLD